MSSVHAASDTRIFHREAKSLVGAGYDVTLIAQHDKNETVTGIEIVALPKPKNRLRRMMGLWRVFRLAAKQNADVYHFHDPELIPIAILLKLSTRKKIIYDIHEDVPKQILTKEWLPRYLRGPVSRITAFFESIAFSVFDAVIVAGDDIAHHLPRSPKLVVVGNYAPTEIVRQIEALKGGTEELPVIIYAGELAADRCVREIVQAANSLQDKVKLVLLGGFAAPLFEKELRAIAGSNVEFVGQVSWEAVLSHLARANVGLVLFRPSPNSTAAGQRNRKLYEYMAAGLPVITCNFPSWKEIVEGSNCGLTVNPLDPAEIARAIEYLIANPVEARAMGENGRKAVLQKYNWETESKKLLNIYANLMKAA
jgi:glycosyltransferase involved in cell wall biosynthesis